jgi:RNA polymerase sigma factor (sigma-70 family)
MAVLEKMGELEEEERDLLSMHYFEGMPYERIAEIQGCSSDQARRLCTRSLRRLMRRIRA